jgi:hypothetical protein
MNAEDTAYVREVWYAASNCYIRAALLTEAVADLATFEIAKALGSHFSTSEARRIRWWRIYSLDPSLYREAAARCWERRGEILKRHATT